MMSSTQTEAAERATIDPPIQRLLVQAINSPLKLHLALLFHEDPHLEGSARQITERIYRDIWSTREALRDLARDTFYRHTLTRDIAEPASCPCCS